MNQFILHNHTAMKWKIGMKFIFYVHISTSGWKPFQFAQSLFNLPTYQDFCWPKPPPHRNLVVGGKFSNSPIKPICIISFFAVAPFCEQKFVSTVNLECTGWTPAPLCLSSPNQQWSKNLFQATVKKLSLQLLNQKPSEQQSKKRPPLGKK